MDDQELGVALVSKHERFVPFAYECLKGDDGFIETPFDPVINETLDKTFTGEITRLVINIPPRLGKTLRAVQAYVARGFALNPQSCFIHSSFSNELVQENSVAIRDIINHPNYQRLFPHVAFKEDTNTKGLWKTTKGGTFLAKPAGGTITGFGAGIVGQKEFSGCFPYWEIVNTEEGPIKIGELVERSISTRVWSMSSSGVAELKPITRHFINPPSSLVKVSMSGGAHFECTPNHKIYTRRGMVRADELNARDRIISTDSFNLVDGNPELHAKLSSWLRSVHRFSNDFVGMFSPVIPLSVGEVVGDRLPSLAHFDLPNNSIANSVLGFESLYRFGAREYFNNLGSSKFRARAFFENWKRAVNFSVRYVFASSSVAQVFQPIVGRVSVSMKGFISRRAVASKRQKNQAVNLPRLYDSIDREPEIKMSASVFSGFECPALYGVCDKLSTFCVDRFNVSCFASNTPGIADRVKAFIARDRFPLAVDSAGHIDKTYCLEVRDNHNFTISKAFAVVSNCLLIDDPLKPSDGLSDTTRTFINGRWENTFRSRLNDENVPVIVIMQRIHEEDFTNTVLLEGENDWHHLVLPMFIDKDYEYKESGIYIPHNLPEGSLWPSKMSDKQALARMEDIQYSQEPTPAKGEVYEREWFKRYTDIPPHIKSWSIYCDTASKVKKYNDYSVFQLWAKTVGNKGYLIKQWREKVKVPFLLGKLEEFYRDAEKISGERRIKISIEDKDSGVGLIQGLELLSDDTGSNYRVVAIKRTEGKYARALTAAPHIKDGEIYIKTGPEGDSVITEATKFKPDDSHKHDDQIDPMNDFINFELPKAGYTFDNLG